MTKPPYEPRVEYKCKKCNHEWWTECGVSAISSKMFDEPCPQCNSKAVTVLEINNIGSER